MFFHVFQLFENMRKPTIFGCSGPELELVPVGYQRHSDGWRCAPGYAGEAKDGKDEVWVGLIKSWL